MHTSCETYQARLLLRGWIAALRSQRRANLIDATKPPWMRKALIQACSRMHVSPYPEQKLGAAS